MSEENTLSLKIEPSSKMIVLTWIVSILFVGFLFVITSPFGDLLGPSQWATAGLLHGTLALLGIIVVTVGVYMGWKLYNGQFKAIGDLKLMALLSVITSAATIIFGNWIYIGYRATGGPRSWFLANMPSVHNVFFEFKEFFALFTLPLAVGTAYTIWTYKDTLIEDKKLRTSVALLLVTIWGIFTATFILGAAITKLRSV